MPPAFMARLALASIMMILSSLAFGATPLRVAAASDLRYALDEIVQIYQRAHPGADVDVIYGASGKMTTQIMNGAPYDLFFSADIRFPEQLAEKGLAATKPSVYAIGRIVLWSNTLDASQLTLADLANERIARVAIAQPAHAPYGMRAREALQSVGLWDAVQPKLVFGENIAQTAQMTRSSAADVGIIALSLALFPDMAEHPHRLIDESLHDPLTQGFVITKRAENNPAAHAFAQFMATEQVRDIKTRYGFVLPE